MTHDKRFKNDRETYFLNCPVAKKPFTEHFPESTKFSTAKKMHMHAV